MITVSSRNPELIKVTGCTCPGNDVLFKCTTIGEGFTLWLGTAFDCSEIQNEIILQNRNFGDGGYSASQIQSCNAGAIYAHDFLAQDNCYTSHLTITFSIGLDGQNVMCVYTSGTEVIETTIGISILTRTRGIYLLFLCYS